MVVLKRLDGDCLLGGNLHPTIRDRLARIRELAHRHVATLISIERDADGGVFGVWEHIEGTDVATWASDPLRSSQQAMRMLRELVLAVESLHGLGIVHGAIHRGNVVIDASGELRLLDVSPLLYHDQLVDLDALGSLVRQVLEGRQESESEIGRRLLRHIDNHDALRDLSASISRSMESQGNMGKTQGDHDQHEHRIRGESLRWAMACSAAAVVLAIGGWWVFTHYLSPVAIPVEAPVEAMRAR